jgi:uncharacterized repeat protein (TIGR03803 family)
MKRCNYQAKICAIAALTVAAAEVLPAQTFTVLKRFNIANGAVPAGPVVQGLDGNFYGTTSSGGANSGGTVFRITPAGKLATLYSFCHLANCIDGHDPFAALILGTDGAFYGTTQVGGSSVGTVFRITRAGVLTTLYSFCAQFNCADGGQPQAPLVQGSDGNFYGTTVFGGEAGNAGTIFKMTPKGTLTTIHSFCTAAATSCPDGLFPSGGLVQGADGNFYGATPSSILLPLSLPRGVVFQIAPNGDYNALDILCLQTNCADGANPNGGLVQGADGKLYGATAFGGTSSNCPNGCGTIFKFSPNTLNDLTVVHSFNSTDGAIPETLILANDGNFYGTTQTGGFTNTGTIFRMTPDGTVTVLRNLSSTDGIKPLGGLMQATDGNLYGTASFGGGNDNSGTVWRMSLGLSPLVKTLPLAGKAGSAVKILGNNLTGTTSVTFNGVPATFKVVSATEITTTVPTGATTGLVQVTTPAATLSSSPGFQVLP